MIDANIPKHLTGIEVGVPCKIRRPTVLILQDAKEYEQADSAQIRSNAAAELTKYLWENYIEWVQRVRDCAVGLTRQIERNVAPLHPRCRQCVWQHRRLVEQGWYVFPLPQRRIH